MKRKLLFAIVALLCTIGVRAQSWTAPCSDPVSGQEYYIMNVGVGQFLTGANSWGTQISMTESGTGLRVRMDQGTYTVGGVSLSGWEIVNVTNSNKLFFRDSEGAGFVDKGGQDKGFVWNITKVNGAYRLQTAVGDPAYPAAIVQYANATAAGGAVVFDNGPMASNIDWMFFTPEQAAADNVVARARLYAALIRAYNEGMDTSDASAVYENASATADEMAAAVTALNSGRYANALAKASNSDPRDITEFVLTNSDFSTGNISGWETNYVSGQQANNIGYQGSKYVNGTVAISKFIEAWKSGNGWLGDGYLRQTVQNLREGKYVLEADAIAVNQSGSPATTTGALLYIHADGVDFTKALSTGNGAPQHFSTEFLFSGEGDVEFGLKSVSATCNWLCADNFKVTFYGIDLSAYVTQLENAVAEFNALDESAAIPAIYTAQKAIVTDNDKEWDSSKTYAAAIAAIQNATATVQNSITAKANLDAAVAAAEAVEFTIPTSLYEPIAAAIEANNKVYDTIDEYVTATAAINQAVIDNVDDTIVSAYSLVSDAWAMYHESYTDADGAKATFKAIIDAIDEKTTADEITAAIEAANLSEAVKNFVSNVTLADGHRFDITNFFLINPDFEVPTPNQALPPGWTITITGQNCGQQNRTDTNPETGLSITNFIEAWHPSQLGNGVIAQTVSSLPEGTYVLECDASICHDPAGADDITGANLFIQSPLKTERQAISNVRLYINHYARSFVHNGEGEVTFGLEANNTNANWLSADNFKVYFAGGIDYKSILETAVAEFEALKSSVDPTIYAIYAAVVAEYNKTWSNKSEYQTAIAAVNQASEDMQAHNSAKLLYDAALTAATSALNDEANVNVTGDELTNLNEAIADTPEATKESYEAKTTALTTATNEFTAAAPAYNAYVAYKAETAKLFGDEVANSVDAPANAAAATAAISALKVAQYEKVVSDYPYSLNSKIGEFNTWTQTATSDGVADTPQTLSNEHWSAATHTYYEQGVNGWAAQSFTVNYTKATTLPAGDYVIKVATRASANVSGTISATATNNTVAIANVGASSKGITVEGVASFDEGTFANNGTGYGWEWRFLPFTLTEDGEVTITIEAASSSVHGWVSIADAELLSANNIATDVEYYDDDDELNIVDVELANVTIHRTVKDGFNTVVLPFDLTESQVNAAFGAGAEVYAFSEESTDPLDVTISFTKVNAGTISANVPVLVKATVASTEQVFNGVQVVAPTSDVQVAGNIVKFKGVYAPGTVAAGDYFISDGVLYKSAGETDIKAFRAYIDAQEAAVEVKMFIDGLATAISEIDADAAAKPQGAIFNLAGQRVNKAQKGIYIVNGKKVLVK